MQLQKNLLIDLRYDTKQTQLRIDKTILEAKFIKCDKITFLRVYFKTFFFFLGKVYFRRKFWNQRVKFFLKINVLEYSF